MTNSPVHIDRSRRVRVWSTVMLGMVGCAIVATIARVVQLKTSPDPRLVDAMRHNDGSPIQYLRRPATMPRGVIYDRRGQVVAMDVIGHTLYIDPRHIWTEAQQAVDKAERARQRAIARGREPTEVDISLDPIGDAVSQLSERLGVNPDAFMRTVMERIPASLRTLRADATPEEIRKIPRYIVLREKVSDAELDRLHGMRLAGVGLHEQPIRVYPFGETAATLVGLVGTEHRGLGGMERKYERALGPEAGSIVRLVDNRNQTIMIPAEGYEPGQAGESVQIAIDMVIQGTLERLLDEAVGAANAGGGRGIVVDVETGEILAMHDVVRTSTGRSPIAIDKDRAVHPAFGRNRCITDPYEPGSTFKPFVWSIATMLGKARPDETLPTPSAGGFVVRDGKSSRAIRDVAYYGPSTWKKVLQKSMNAGMSIVALRMTKRQMQDGIAAFGFGRRTGCGLPGETAGIVTAPSKWSMVYTQCSVAMGQEIGVTVVQMARAFTAFCRDGSMVDLSLERLPPDVAPRTTRVVPEAVALATRDAMRGVMTEGTGQRANKIAKYEMFGKSGTAQLPRPKHGYYQDRYISSFIAGAPYEQPKIVVLIVIDDPDKHRLGYNNYGGGALAGPVATKLVNETLEYLGIPSTLDVPDTAPRGIAAAH